MAAKKQGSSKKAKKEAVVLPPEPIVVPFPFEAMVQAVPAIAEMERYNALLQDAQIFEDEIKQLNDERRIILQDAHELQLRHNRLSLDLDEEAARIRELWKLDPAQQDAYDKACRAHQKAVYDAQLWGLARQTALKTMPEKAEEMGKVWADLTEKQREAAAKKEEADARGDQMRATYKVVNAIRAKYGLGKTDPTDAILQEAGIPVSA